MDPEEFAISNVLFCWELGGGWGHIGRVSPLARGLAEAGHAVGFVSRDVVRATAVGMPGRVLAAPVVSTPRERQIPNPMNYAEVLCNVGWANDASLTGLVRAWRDLIMVCGPDLVVVDHAPGAALAARTLRCPFLSVSAGFAVPPDLSRLPLLREGVPEPRVAAAHATEREVLERINRLGETHGLAPLTSVGAMFREAESVLLTTVPELDHYTDRLDGGDYVGSWTTGSGMEPMWPRGDGPKVFAYLNGVPVSHYVLRRLERRGIPTVAYVDGDEPCTNGGSVTVLPKPADLAIAARECDVAITNAGHGVATTMLRAGKPLVMIPRVLEQQLLAGRIRALGAGEILSITQPRTFEDVFASVVESDTHRVAAEAFAERYADWVDEDRAAHVADTIGSAARRVAGGAA